MVKLSDALKQRQFDASACVAHVHHVDHVRQQAEQENSSNSSSKVKVLTYRDAWLAFKEHKAWLQNLISNELADTPTPLPLNDSTVDGVCVPLSEAPSIDRVLLLPKVEVRAPQLVLAYIVSNDTDPIISILAAADMKGTPHVDAVALLNTRWTPLEMATVLQCQSSSRFSSSTNTNTTPTVSHPCEQPKTIILYSATSTHDLYRDHQLRDKAFHTKQLLRHSARIIQIPCFAQKYLIIQEWYPNSIPKYSQSDDAIHDLIRRISNDSTVEDALVLFTSGTTSTSGSKGVRLSHSALWIQALAKLCQPCRYNSTTRLLSTTVPIFHVGGFNSTLAVWIAGGTWMIPQHLDTAGSTSTRVAQLHHIMKPKGGGFDANALVDMISHPIVPTNTLVVVPAMLHAVLQRIHDNIDNHTDVYPQVDLVLIGGQSASKTMLKKLALAFPKARLIQTYACTEASSSMTFHDVSSWSSSCLQKHHVVRQPMVLVPSGHCIGFPPSHVQLQLMDPNAQRTSIITKPYEIGVFVTCGPHVMSGYWKRHCSTHDDNSDNNLALRRDVPCPSSRHFVTNDLGFQHENGQFYFCGRVQDVIRTGGETVLALEVEHILVQHDQIDDCAVFGIPDERLGEMVCAAIVVKSSSLSTGREDNDNGDDEAKEVPSLDTIRQYCRDGLAGYKHPRRIFRVSHLPRNSSGKVLKYQLVELFQNPKSKL